MVKKGFIVIVIVVAAVFSYYHLFATEEAKIRREFRQLGKWASKSAGDTKVVLAAQINRIKQKFAEECLFTFQANDSEHRVTHQDISTRLFAMLSQYTTTKLSFYDFSVTIVNDQTAQVRVTADFQGQLTSGQSTFETHEIECLMIKTDQHWILTEITLIDVLQR